MTELHPPPVSVKERAKEINARTAAAAAQEEKAVKISSPQWPTSKARSHHERLSSLPESPDERRANQNDDVNCVDTAHEKVEVEHQASSSSSALHRSPPLLPPRVQSSSWRQQQQRRSSEGDLLRTQTQTTVSLPRRRSSVEGVGVIGRPYQGHNVGASQLVQYSKPYSVEVRASLSDVAEEEGGITSGSEVAAKFETPTAGSSGIWCLEPHKKRPECFSSAIFSSTPLPSSAQEKPSPLDDIITALEKICDEFTSKDDVTEVAHDISGSEALPVYESGALPSRDYDCLSQYRQNFPAEDKHQNPQLKNESQVDAFSLSRGDARSAVSVSQNESSLKTNSFREHFRRSSVPDDGGYHNSTYRTKHGTPYTYREIRGADKPKDGLSWEDSDNGNCTEAVNGLREVFKGDAEFLSGNLSPASKPSVINSECTRTGSEKHVQEQPEEKICLSSVDYYECSFVTGDNSAQILSSKSSLPAYATLGRTPTGRRNHSDPLSYDEFRKDGETVEVQSEIDKVRNILASLDFAKYKRGRNPLMENSEPSTPNKVMDKSPKPPRSPKTSNPRLKDLFDLLKPSFDSTANRPFLISRSSSFTNAESDSLSNSRYGLDKVSEQDEMLTKTSTLPRRKTPKIFASSAKECSPVPAVSSCPSIVKLNPDESETDPTNDEGLVSDYESGPCYVNAYNSCVTPSLPTRKGHVRSSSDNVNLIPTQHLLMPDNLKYGSSEKLTSSPDKRKRRKGIGGPAMGFAQGSSEHAKSGNGRSLTYPPQRKSSVSEEETEFSSVDTNGFRLLKPSPGLNDEDSVKLQSDLSLADSHLCSSEAAGDEIHEDLQESLLSAPSDLRHLCVDNRSGSGVVGSNGKAKKKHHSDPGGDMSGEGVAFPEIIGVSRSEPDLGDTSSLDPETSKPPETSDTGNLRLIIDSDRASEPPSTPKFSHHSRHIRVGSEGLGQQYFFSNEAGDRQGTETLPSTKSPQEQRRYSKRRLRGPYGEMLEEEMRKSGEKQKPTFSDLSFLQELCETRGTNKGPETAPITSTSASSSSRQIVFSSSQSLDDATIKNDSSDSVLVPKRKISANYPLLGGNSSAQLQAGDDSNVKVLEGSNSPESSVDHNDNKSVFTQDKDTHSPKSSDGYPDFSKMHERNSDTRTHVVGELYDTEKSYVESLQILANKYMKPLKSPEYAGVVDAGLVDEIFFQIPEILNHHESFLEALKQRLTTWDSKQKVGDVFVEAFTKQQVIDTYTAFINNWKSAKDAIKIASQAKPAFARFLEHMSREHKGKLTLDALLIMPVQRIPRYELLIKELLKHTSLEHPDHQLLILAQKEVHDLAVKINRMEREAFQQEQMQQRVREVEQLIEGVMDLVQPDREFIRHDMVTIPGGLGTKKERCLFLFSDVLLITSMKRKSGTMRKPSSTSSSSQNSFSGLEMNKYKLLTRFSLDNLDITKSTDSSVKRLMKEIENLEEDVVLLTQIIELASNLTIQHQLLDEAAKDLLGNVSKNLTDKQNADAQLVSLELTVTTQEGVDSLTILFSSPEKRASWECAFNEAKQKLALSTDRRPPPEFMHPLPIRKTRAGLQFTCATATLGLNHQGLRDVWVCNSDGYVGQVCVLSLQPEPTVMSCNGVCNARILTIASIPAAASLHSDKCRWRSTMPDNMTGVSIEVEEVDEEFEDERTNNGNIQLDSESSDEEEEGESPDEEKQREERKRGSSVPRDEGHDDMDHRQPTMWLGTEDGCIHVYNCNDNIRTKKNKIKIQHSAAIHCIIYLDNRVFVALANGELHIYKKDPAGGWSSSEPQKVPVGNSVTPITKMLAVAGKLWCGCQNYIKVLNTSTLQIEHSFPVSNDVTRSVLCMVTSGLGVWIALQQSAVIRLFHATSYECLLDVNVAPAVTKMLAGCDDIIRQHKAACLRVTAMLACKDLLWIGTSAGVVLTLPLPHLTSTTTKLDGVPNVSGIPHGHTGHVRFLTCVEMTPGTSLDLPGYGKYGHRSLRNKESTSGRRASTTATAGCKLLIISGGDGYEDFSNSGLSEAAGRDDSTNHLLLWQV